MEGVREEEGVRSRIATHTTLLLIINDFNFDFLFYLLGVCDMCCLGKRKIQKIRNSVYAVDSVYAEGLPKAEFRL